MNQKFIDKLKLRKKLEDDKEFNQIISNNYKSCNDFKLDIIHYIISEYNTLNSVSYSQLNILDVGAGSGCYGKLLNHAQDKKLIGFYLKIAVEAFQPNIDRYDLQSIYELVYNQNILDYEYKKQTQVCIMGDVLEHLTVDESKLVLERMKKYCIDVVVVVPWNYIQSSMEDGDFEEHKQSDLTPELMLSRYDGARPLFKNDKIGVYLFKNLTI